MAMNLMWHIKRFDQYWWRNVHQLEQTSIMEAFKAVYHKTETDLMLTQPGLNIKLFLSNGRWLCESMDEYLRTKRYHAAIICLKPICESLTLLWFIHVMRTVLFPFQSCSFRTCIVFNEKGSMSNACWSFNKAWRKWEANAKPLRLTYRLKRSS